MFKMASQRRTVVIALTDQMRIFYLACEIKQEGSVSKVNECQLAL